MQKQSSNPYASIMFLSESFERHTLMPSDVVKSQLERIANLDRKLGSYQAIYESDALEAAKAAAIAESKAANCVEWWRVQEERFNPELGIPRRSPAAWDTTRTWHGDWQGNSEEESYGF